MNLCGRLGLTTLGDLLGSLHRVEARGTLELLEETGPAAGRNHRLHFDRGQLLFIESALLANRLGEMLVAKRLLSRAQQVQLLAALQDNPGKTTGQFLTELNWVSHDELRETVRQQTTERLFALYELKDARVTFHVARPMPLEPSATAPLTPEEFLRGRPRTRDRKPAATDRARGCNSPENTANGADPMRRRALLLLGLESHADTADVKRAFRRMAARLHPDRHLIAPRDQQELARERFSQVTEAYHLLTG